MQFSGTHILSAPLEQVWTSLLDPEILARITPGISKLEPVGDNKYTAISNIKLGPVNGAFKGEIEVADLNEPHSFVLKMKMNSRVGNVSAEGSIALKRIDDEQTEIDFSGAAKLSGTIARMGQRVLGGVANAMTQQFFKALDKELA